MNDVLIVVEGKADIVFLIHYLAYLSRIDSPIYKEESPVDLSVNGKNIRIIFTKGKDRIKKLAPFIRQHIDKGYKVLFVFDADDDVSLSQDNILTQWGKFDLSVKPEIFLFPNDRDSGTLETLLIQCIHTCNAPLLDYWQNLPGKQEDILSELNTRYKACGGCTTRQTLHGPDDKMAIYSYAYQLTGNKAHETKRDYSDKKVWDLDSEALEPLRDFLRKNILEDNE